MLQIIFAVLSSGHLACARCVPERVVQGPVRILEMHLIALISHRKKACKRAMLHAVVHSQDRQVQIAARRLVSAVNMNK